ncbi:hypothetical protein [Halalkalicoccus ordinarius]|uniref:hypothetical protein n=1 Tax=Halalkalicoccus ordinarius TaxID=3116651 RepID=UPI00300ED027
MTVLGYAPLTVFISLAYTIALAPYAVLTSYVFRAAMVTKRTPEEGPFVLDADRETAYDQRSDGQNRDGPPLLFRPDTPSR